MKAILIRIGADHSYGNWNAPADPRDGRFVYVPIPESRKTTFLDGCATDYGCVLPALQRFAAKRNLDVRAGLRFPSELATRMLHLDPDFDNMTYGDDGAKRGSVIRSAGRGDLLVFYAGLRSVADGALIYALVGKMVIDQVVDASRVESTRRHENAHTRKTTIAPDDIVVRALPGESGLFSRFIAVGEYRDRAYRIRPDVLAAWGGLSVKDGYVQRSARPPTFLDPGRFCAWLSGQDVELVTSNNWNDK